MNLIGSDKRNTSLQFQIEWNFKKIKLNGAVLQLNRMDIYYFSRNKFGLNGILLYKVERNPIL